MLKTGDCEGEGCGESAWNDGSGSKNAVGGGGEMGEMSKDELLVGQETVGK